MAIDFAAGVGELRTTLASIETVLDLPAMRGEAAELEAQASEPDLWDDPGAAQKVTSRLSFVQGELRRVEALRQRARRPADPRRAGRGRGRRRDAWPRPRPSSAHSQKVDLRAGGPHAAGRRVRRPREALVTIRSEAGGVDAADWAEMLLRMYTRYCERHDWPVEVYDISYAEEAGIKSATFAVKAPYAYGTLSVEQGTHRLVRISPFDNQGRRQTSFAGGRGAARRPRQTDHLDIPENEIRVDVFRSSGPGGQSVNTTDSAVRITHLPTGIVVTCQNEKSQIQNRAAALRVLEARLLERRRQEERAAMDALKDRHLGLLGQPDALLRPAPLPDGQGPADRVRDGQHRRACSTARSTSSSRPASAGAGRAGR